MKLVARGARHEQHRQLLARLPLADVVRAHRSRSASRAARTRSPTSTSRRCLFLTGANPTEGHPVVGARMKEARLRGAKLIVADPRRIELADDGGRLPAAPAGHERRALQRARARHRARRPRRSRASSTARAEGFEAFRELLAAYDPKQVEAITGVPAALVEKAAHLYATTPPAGDLLRARRHRAGAGRRRACAASRTSRSSRATSASPARARTRCAARTTCRARATWARSRTYLTMYRQDGRRRRPRAVRGASGAARIDPRRAAS